MNRFLTDVLNSEIYNKIGETPVGVGIHYDYTNEKIVEYLSKGSHPEYVVRLTRMLQQLASQPGLEGWKIHVDTFAKHMRKGK